MLLTFNVEKQIIMRTDTEKVVTNSMNYLYACFTFSEEWTGEKTAVFTAQKKTYNALLDENNTCLVPWEVLTGSIFTVSVFCGDLITANKVIIYTIPSGYEVGDESRIPTPEIYTQVIEKLNEIEAEIDPEAILQIIDTYLADKDFVTENDVETIISQYVAEHVHGVPTGGTTGQILVKSSSTDYDTEWADGGSGSGDMTKSTYDPNGVVEDAGGIEGYVEEECVNKSEFTIIAPNNLFDINTSKPNFRPSTSAGSVYGDGTAQNGINTTNLMPCSASEKFKTNLTSVPSYVRSSYYDANKVFVGNLTTFTVDSDGYVYFQAGTWTNVAYVCIWGTFSTDEWNNLIVDDYDNFTEYKKVIVNDLYLSDDNVVMAKDRLGLSDSDILKGKKWAVIGDSFTAGDFGGVTPPTIPSGKYAGMVATYPYLIATRCGMDIQSLFQNGRTLAYAADGTVTNSVMSVYQNIDADADYLTIYIGINDSHHRTGDTGVIPLGAITDSETSTFYGAWNTLLTWMITNRPNLHIGIIVSNGCETDDYRTATIAIAEKYGIPYIDMNGDRHTPCMMRSTNEAIDSSIRAQRTNAWRVSSTNGHPNADCHVFEATFIENFLRSL